MLTHYWALTLTYNLAHMEEENLMSSQINNPIAITDKQSNYVIVVFRDHIHLHSV